MRRQHDGAPRHLTGDDIGIGDKIVRASDDARMCTAGSYMVEAALFEGRSTVTSRHRDIRRRRQL